MSHKILHVSKIDREGRISLGKKKLDRLGFSRGDYIQIVEITIDGHDPLICLIKADARF